MVRQQGGRWDVGAKDNAVYLERISDSDERLFDDSLAPEEARALAELLTKYADKVENSEDSHDDSEDSDDEDSEDSDDDSDDEDSEDSDDDSDDEDSDDEDSDESSK